MPDVSLAGLHFEVLYPLVIHPQAAAIDAETAELCQRIRLWLPHMHQYNTMTSYLYPYAEAERVVAINLLMNLLYYIDDLFDSGRPTDDEHLGPLPDILTACVQTLVSGEKPAEISPIYEAAWELHHRLWGKCDPQWFYLLIKSLEDHFTSVVKAVPLDEKGCIDVEQYISIREFDGGSWTTIHLIEFALGRFLPHDIRDETSFQQMTQCVAQAGALVNDLFSYEKEVMRYGVEFNLVVALMKGEGLSFEAAVGSAIVRINDILAQFESAAVQPLYPQDPVLSAVIGDYVQGLRHLLSAAWHWQLATNRYRSPNSPFVELREMLPETQAVPV